MWGCFFLDFMRTILSFLEFTFSFFVHFLDASYFRTFNCVYLFIKIFLLCFRNEFPIHVHSGQFTLYSLIPSFFYGILTWLISTDIG